MTGVPSDQFQGFASPPCLPGEQAAPDPRNPRAVALWRRAGRWALSVEARRTVAAALAWHLGAFLASHVPEVAGRVVSGYWPIEGEPDLRPWIEGRHARGALVALPVVGTRGRRSPSAAGRGAWPWNAGTGTSPFRQRTPHAQSRRSPSPLLGWDMEGCRLGCGGGRFGRTPATLDPRPMAIGPGLRSARPSTIHVLDARQTIVEELPPVRSVEEIHRGSAIKG